MSAYLKVLGCLCLLFFVCIGLQAQNKKKLLEFATHSMQEKDYYGASVYYEKALDKDPGNIDILKPTADAHRLFNDYEGALAYYRQLERLDEEDKYPETVFWIATMHKYNADYDKALEHFKAFLSAYQKDDYYTRKAEQEVKSCVYAKKLVQNPVSWDIHNAGSGINTVQPEFSPFLGTDSVLYYTGLQAQKIEENEIVKGKKQFQLKIYKAAYDAQSGIWKEQDMMPQKINNAAFNTGNGVWGPDQRKFFFSSCDENHNCKILYTEKENGSWRKPQALNAHVNKEDYTNTQPFPARIQGQYVLFFVSDRPGGEGKLDIWYSVEKNGEYGEPINLNINSIDNEISPWYDTVNHVLYFSSDWYKGLGGMDVFRATGNLLNLGKPENIGYPVNSSVNDIYYKKFGDSLKHGFLASNRKGSYSSKSPTCCNDIYYFRKKQPERPPSDTSQQDTSQAASLQPMHVQLYFHNDRPGPNSMDTTTAIDYMQAYEQYIGRKQEYLDAYTRGLEDREKKQAAQKIRDFFENKVRKGGKMLDSLSDMVLAELQQGRKVNLDVSGFCSPRTTSRYNVNLSRRRVASVRNYFKTYRDSVFYPYLREKADNGGRLKITEKPFGEYMADTTVNDALDNERESIYSVEASQERKVVITYKPRPPEDSVYAEVDLAYPVHHFGSVRKGATLRHTFTFTNTGDTALQVREVRSNAACEVLSYPDEAVEPGETAGITVKMNTTALQGRTVGHVTVLSNAYPGRSTLHLVAEVEDE